MITEFKLCETEAIAASEFEEKHLHKNVNKGAIGGHIDYVFTPNGIGTAITIHCGICGERKNITDYSRW